VPRRKRLNRKPKPFIEDDDVSMAELGCTEGLCGELCGFNFCVRHYYLILLKKTINKKTLYVIYSSAKDKF
jgi:hypothetical protein